MKSNLSFQINQLPWDEKNAFPPRAKCQNTDHIIPAGDVSELDLRELPMVTSKGYT